MAQHHTHPRRPLAPTRLRSGDEACDVIALVVTVPAAAETVCLLVDASYGAFACVVVAGGGRPDDVFSVGAFVREMCRSGPAAHVVLASCRPGRGFAPDDVDRWPELSARFAEAGLELVDWFIRDERMMLSVAALAGEPPKWPS